VIPYTTKEALSFDDIMLVPQESDIYSRHKINLTMTFGKHNPIGLTMPIFAAPMDTVCEYDMAFNLGLLGGVGVVHRYMSYDKQLEIAAKLQDHELLSFFAIGSSIEDYEHAQKLLDLGVAGLVVDTANGHSKLAIDAVDRLRKHPVHIMAGNVSTWEGYKRLSDAGADSVRVGIGGGAACTTRTVTGHGIPTLASIMDIMEKGRTDTGIIADGGIRNSGDAVKAIAAGADAVMLGSVLAGHYESPGHMIGDRKEFRGMASKDAQISRGKVSVIEGISTTVPFRGFVADTLNDFTNGIKSGCSYTGVDRLEDLSKEAIYVRVSTLSNNETKKG